MSPTATLSPEFLAALMEGSVQDRVKATAGLTPEQVEAIPRLVALYQEVDIFYFSDRSWAKEHLSLRKIFPRREP